MKNLKNLTEAEWEQYTTEAAADLFKKYPESGRHITYGDHSHPEVECPYGIAWEGYERERWTITINDKYNALKAEARSKGPKFEGFNNVKDLLKIKTCEDIKALVIEDEYEDDHLQCADVIINGVPIEFNWYDNLGFLLYWDESPRAFEDLLNAIETSVKCWEDEQVANLELG